MKTVSYRLYKHKYLKFIHIIHNMFIVHILSIFIDIFILSLTHYN